MLIRCCCGMQMYLSMYINKVLKFRYRKRNFCEGEGVAGLVLFISSEVKDIDGRNLHARVANALSSEKVSNNDFLQRNGDGTHWVVRNSTL